MNRLIVLLIFSILAICHALTVVETLTIQTVTVSDEAEAYKREIMLMLQEKIEGATPMVETSTVKRKPGKNTTIWTTVNPPSACESKDGCCPKSVVTVTETSFITSTDSFIYTVTETIQVPLFRGTTIVTTTILTTTEKLQLVSTLRKEATIVSTSFLTTTVPISRLFISTSRSLTPEVRTLVQNSSSTSTRTQVITLSSLSTITSSVAFTSVNTSFTTFTYTTEYIYFTQTVFNPFAVGTSTSFTVILRTALTYLSFPTLTETFTFLYSATAPTVTIFRNSTPSQTVTVSTSFQTTTTDVSIINTISFISTITWSRIY